jgi:hypothetical protein
MKIPIHVPTIAPVDLGAQPTNQRLSPMVKWRYIIMLPIFMVIPWSMFMTMPLSWARVPTIKNVGRESRAMKCIVGVLLRDHGTGAIRRKLWSRVDVNKYKYCNDKRRCGRPGLLERDTVK